MRFSNKREFLARRLRDAGVLRFLERASRRPCLLVVSYHRISEQPEIGSFSPEGATWYSPGRQPRGPESTQNHHPEPRRGGVAGPGAPGADAPGYTRSPLRGSKPSARAPLETPFFDGVFSATQDRFRDQV